MATHVIVNVTAQQMAERHPDVRLHPDATDAMVAFNLYRGDVAGVMGYRVTDTFIDMPEGYVDERLHGRGLTSRMLTELLHLGWFLDKEVRLTGDLADQAFRKVAQVHGFVELKRSGDVVTCRWCPDHWDSASDPQLV